MESSDPLIDLNYILKYTSSYEIIPILVEEMSFTRINGIMMNRYLTARVVVIGTIIECTDNCEHVRCIRKFYISNGSFKRNYEYIFRSKFVHLMK